MLNPVLSNFHITFTPAFFPEHITNKYDKFLFQKNYPFKTLEGYFLETIQNLEIPGVNLQTIAANGLNNLGKNMSGPNGFPNTTVNRQYPGTAPLNETIESTTVTLSLRNTILNWMYCYEVLYKYYKRTREMTDFGITLTMDDSAGIPMIRFLLSDCFISGMPGLSFAYNQSFSESKTFDCVFSFNKFDVEFIVPGFDVIRINLRGGSN